MKCRFGLHLDGQYGRQPLNQLGMSDMGPLGLLGMLETQLGLVAPSVTAAQRVVQYRDCLQQLNHADRFFHQTFQVDDFGTAATLLGWRDEWRLHGWRGQIGEGESRRLHDMVAVEVLAAQHLTAGLAERLSLVDEALQQRKVKINAIELLDPLDYFPLLWRRILQQLPIQEPAAFKAEGKGMLGELQRALLHKPTGKIQPLIWQDDGTVQLVRSETSLLATRWLAETISSTGDVLYVATADAARVDSFLGAAAHPNQGLSEVSAFRPALQLLPLLLELLWQPLNVHALIQFLTHPICPVRGRIRRKLATLQGDYPGVGGPRWDEALNEIMFDAGDQQQEALEAIAFWVNHERFDPESGAPLSFVLERTQQLSAYFTQLPARANPALTQAYAAGKSQCEAFAQNLQGLMDQGIDKLKARQLEQLAAQATARGSDHPLRVAQVGAQSCITHPAAVVTSHQVVVWGPLEAPALPSAWPWSASEIIALREMGCDLPGVDIRLQQVATQWLRPLMAAKDKLILVLPPGEKESHPVLQLVSAYLKGAPVTRLETLLTQSQQTSLKLNQLRHTPLPGRQRWWQLPDDVSVQQEQDYSFSQLEKQIFNPYHWLLTQGAKLRSGSLRAVSHEVRLKGLLAHSLIDRFYQQADALQQSEAQFQNWFAQEFDLLMQQEGAVFLMPGRRMELENLRQSLALAMKELRSLMQRSAITQVETEKTLAGQFQGGPLKGYADMVLSKDDQTRAIVDIKWSGKKHREKLETNRHLQLALYAELIRQRTGQWPQVAYFMVRQGQLLACDDGWFKGIHRVKQSKDAKDENTAQLWQRFLSTWTWRQAQFKAGRYEVVLEESEAPDSVAPEDGLPIEVMNQEYNDCKRLAGWEADA